MSILVISDLHADIEALQSILSIVADERFVDLYSKVEKILNLGDTVDRGYHPREVIHELQGLQQSIPVVSVLGNHDEALLFRRPVSGSNVKSIEAHANSDDYEGFLRKLPQRYLDKDERIIAVHGGPINPRELGDGWLFEYSWQRISTTAYLDASGYHYTPEEAFNYVKREFGDGYIVFCGHNHEQAAFSDRKGDLLSKMHKRQGWFAGREVALRCIEREPRTSYLIRVGIAGHEGYGDKLNRAHFGLIWRSEKRERVGLFSSNQFKVP